jgi:hypothetical protein
MGQKWDKTYEIFLFSVLRNTKISRVERLINQSECEIPVKAGPRFYQSLTSYRGQISDMLFALLDMLSTLQELIHL